MYKPDYGLKLFQNGVRSDTNLHFPSFPLYSITIISAGNYTTMVNKPLDGVVYALSLDFSHTQLMEILEYTSSISKNMILHEIAKNPSISRTIDLSTEIIFNATAQLGELQTSPNENYMPLILQKIEPDMYYNHQKTKLKEEIKKEDNNSAILKEILELCSMHEKAIQSHPVKTLSLYNSLKGVLRSGQHKSWEEYYDDKELLLDPTNIKTINDYIVSLSFISAWYHLNGDKKQRDKATHSCVNLISSLGITANPILLKYIETEKLWRYQMKKNTDIYSSNNSTLKKVSIFFDKKIMTKSKILLKNIFLIIGFGILAFLGSVMYQVILPYLIEWLTLGSGMEGYIRIIAPSPLVILIILWLYITGNYFFMQNLIKASKFIFFLSVIIGIIMLLYLIFKS